MSDAIEIDLEEGTAAIVDDTPTPMEQFKLDLAEPINASRVVSQLRERLDSPAWLQYRGSSRIPGLMLGVRSESDTSIFRPFDDDPNWERFPHKRDVIEHGHLRLPDGAQPDPALATRIKDRLLGKSLQAPVFDPTSPGASSGAYIPGLWNRNTVPAFVGPKGWGKTWFLCQLSSALVIPGNHFLDFFDPAVLGGADRQRDVWLINSESPPGDVHQVLLNCGLSFGYRRGVPCYYSDEYGPDDAGALIVDHLTERGGPREFDLTDDVKDREWGRRLIEYGDRSAPPMAVIADGVTSVLGNDTARYGAFTSRFKNLIRRIGVDCGLGVLHSPMSASINTPMNGVESMGEWDGMWIAESPRFPIEPRTPRYLYVLRRMLGPEQPRRRVVMGSDGLLTMNRQPGGEARSAHDGSDDDQRRILLVGQLQAAGGAGMWTRDICGDDYTANRDVLLALEAEGVVKSEKVQQGRARGAKWYMADLAARKEA